MRRLAALFAHSDSIASRTLSEIVVAIWLIGAISCGRITRHSSIAPGGPPGVSDLSTSGRPSGRDPADASQNAVWEASLCLPMFRRPCAFGVHHRQGAGNISNARGAQPDLHGRGDDGLALTKGAESDILTLSDSFFSEAARSLQGAAVVAVRDHISTRANGGANSQQ